MENYYIPGIWNALLIDTIEYGGIYEIDFERVSKNSTSTTHEATFEINQTKAVDRIQVIVDGQDEYYYDLTLTSAVNPNHVLLTQIDMVGGSDQLTTEFTYNDKRQGQRHDGHAYPENTRTKLF